MTDVWVVYVCGECVPLWDFATDISKINRDAILFKFTIDMDEKEFWEAYCRYRSEVGGTFAGCLFDDICGIARDVIIPHASSNNASEDWERFIETYDADAVIENQYRQKELEFRYAEAERALPPNRNVILERCLNRVVM